MGLGLGRECRHWTRRRCLRPWIPAEPAPLLLSDVSWLLLCTFFRADVQPNMPSVTERCAESLLLIGAPHPQDWCNGWYAPTSERVRGHTVYRKRDPGQEVRYLYWTKYEYSKGGEWVCDVDRHPDGVSHLGHVPSDAETATHSISAFWKDERGLPVSVPSTTILCKGVFEQPLRSACACMRYRPEPPCTAKGVRRPIQTHSKTRAPHNRAYSRRWFPPLTLWQLVGR